MCVSTYNISVCVLYVCNYVYVCVRRYVYVCVFLGAQTRTHKHKSVQWFWDSTPGRYFFRCGAPEKVPTNFVWRDFREISLCTVFLKMGQSTRLELRLGVKTIVWPEESEFRTPGSQKSVKNLCVQFFVMFSTEKRPR